MKPIGKAAQRRPRGIIQELLAIHAPVGAARRFNEKSIASHVLNEVQETSLQDRRVDRNQPFRCRCLDGASLSTDVEAQMLSTWRTSIVRRFAIVATRLPVKAVSQGIQRRAGFPSRSAAVRMRAASSSENPAIERPVASLVALNLIPTVGSIESRPASTPK